MLIAGIDEAGRGPTLGPLVMAVTVIDKADEEKFVELGVRDSKELTAKERERQVVEIRKMVKEFAVVKIEAQELDTLMVRKSLNEIEAMKAGLLLNSLKNNPEIIFVDSPDLKAESFAQRIKKYYHHNVLIKAEHKADKNHPVVSAASIIAKIERDKAIDELKKVYGEIGSGYSHDPLTIQFIESWLKKNDSLPAFVRKRWATSERALNNKFQTKLV